MTLSRHSPVDHANNENISSLRKFEEGRCIIIMRAQE